MFFGRYYIILIRVSSLLIGEMVSSLDTLMCIHYFDKLILQIIIRKSGKSTCSNEHIILLVDEVLKLWIL